jgi:hypothetical protein
MIRKKKKKHGLIVMFFPAKNNIGHDAHQIRKKKKLI